MFNAKQKRLLALDGGGILGVISLQILKTIEDDLRPLSGKGDEFRLRDFFDYIGGTSTGAIIAAGLALGFSVDELIAFYKEDGPGMFRRSLSWPFHKYRRAPLAALLKKKLGTETILELQEQGKLSTDKHLLIVTQNIATDSPWPVSTNPRAKYNDTARRECNLNIGLWQLVRASTAAPYYFPPEEIELEADNPASCRKFEDGAVTPYNNPAFLLYRMATLAEYNCEWPDGEQNMMVVSVGTGDLFHPEPRVWRIGRSALSNATSVPGALMQRIAVENDTLCRTVGRCVYGSTIDSEIGSLEEPLSRKPGDLGRRFLYARYNPDITTDGLRDLGLKHLTGHSYTLDGVSKVPYLREIGRKYAESLHFLEDFAPFVRPPRSSGDLEFIRSGGPDGRNPVNEGDRQPPSG